MGLVAAQLLIDAGVAATIRVWGRDEGSITQLRTTGTSARLPGWRLPKGIEVSTDPGVVLDGAEMVVIAIPTQFVRSALESMKTHIEKAASVVSLSKGVEVGTLRRVTEIATDVLGERPVGTLSGPAIATELAARKPALMVAASADESLAQAVQKLFTTPYQRIYTSDDVIGAEIAGAVKNVIAIAAGIVDGLDAGANAKSALLARGLAEIVRLGAALGADTETFFGLCGVGDLATTCFSPEGRNRSCGEALGKGEDLDAYLARTKSVVEGVATAKSVMAMAQNAGVELPIAHAVYSILYEGLDAKDAIAMLMSRELKDETVG